MINSTRKYGLLALRALSALAFLAAGLAKLSGAAMMVATFQAIGIGQWFRYVTGVIEVGGAILLFMPGLQGIGAGVLAATMIGAMLSHIVILGTATMLPSVILFILTATIAYAYRSQLPIVGNRTA